LLAEQALADRAGDVGAVGIKTNQRVAERWRHRRSDRLRHAEFGLMDGAERRSEGCLLCALGGRRLTRDQRREVLITGLAWQQQQHQDAEAKGAFEITLPPVTQRYHPYAHPDPNKRNVCFM